MYNLKVRLEYFPLALLASSVGHAAFFYYLFFEMRADFSDLPPLVIYSVSLESGDTLGGIVQVAKEEKVEQAPPKIIQEVPKEMKESPAEDTVKVEESPAPKPTPSSKPPASPSPKPKPKPKEEPKKAPAKNYQEALQRYLGESTKAGGKGFGSAGKGGKGAGGGVVKSPEWFRYKETLEYRIREGWNWHDASAVLLTTVGFDMKPDGQIYNIRLIKSSGNSLYDESVLRAVNKANPVPPPKAEFYEDFKSLIMDFTPQDL